MSEKVFLLATGIINPENMQLLKDYSAHTQELMSKAGGKIVSVFKVTETLLGKNIPATLAIVEFQDTDSIKKFMDSPEYKEGIPTRDKCFKELNYFVGNQQQ